MRAGHPPTWSRARDLVAWLVPIALAGYFLVIHPAYGTARVPYVFALLGPPAVLVAAWALAARGPFVRTSVGPLPGVIIPVAVVAIGSAALTVLVAHAVGQPLSGRRVLEYAAVVGAIGVAGGFVGWRLRRLPSPTELVIALALAAMVDMDLYVTSYGVQRDFGIYLRAGHNFLAGAPVYTETPLTTGPTDPTLDPFVYPPITLPFFAAFAMLPSRLAHVLWIAATLTTTVVALRCFGVRWRWLPVLLLWPPVVQGLWVGNADMLVLAAFAAAPWYAALLAFPPMIKLQLGVTGLWLVRERRWRSLAIALGIGVGLVLATLPIVGIDAWVSWVNALVAFNQTARNMPPITGIALVRYLPMTVALLLGLLAVVAALRWRGRDGLADLGLASLAISPTLYPHGFPIGLPAFLRLGTLACWTAIAVTSSFYKPQDWWLLVLVAFAAPYVARLTVRRPSDGPHPLGTATIWGGAPAGTAAM
jgi:Glycosyltransferase family 87